MLENLPKGYKVKIDKDSLFTGLEETNGLMPVEYRVYSSTTEYKNLYLNQKITENVSITVVWNNSTYNQAEYQNFDKIINKIKTLEEISLRYNQEKGSTEDANLRVLKYIKEVRYNGIAWNVLVGSLDSDFIQYVKDNQPSDMDLSSLQQTEFLTDPKTKENVDFLHMIAVVNVILKCGFENYTNVDLASWGGDICQLAIQLKRTGLSGSALQAKADELFNGDANSSFSRYDVLANVDAFNIANLYFNLGNSTISSVLEQYYKLSSTHYRNTIYLQKALPEIYENNEICVTKDEFKQILISRVDNNNLINFWSTTLGESYSTLTEQVRVSVNSFADYYYMR